MDNIPALSEHLSDEELLLKYVIRGDYELLYLHTYLEELRVES